MNNLAELAWTGLPGSAVSESSFCDPGQHGVRISSNTSLVPVPSESSHGSDDPQAVFTFYFPSSAAPRTSERKLTVIQSYVIHGEEFLFERYEGMIILRHEQWSLEGMGPTLFEAEQDLIHRGIELFSIMNDTRASVLSEEAEQMVEFISKL